MLTNRLGFWAAHAFVAAYCGVLLGGFAVQFIGQEFPCPLCILQRMAMMLATLGPAYIIMRARRGSVSLQDYTTGYGIAAIGALSGVAMSSRQVALHLMPKDPGYGSKVMGLHLYTWALITFFIVLAFVAVSMVFAKELVPTGVRWGWPSKLLIWLFIGLVAANLLVVFAEEGLHWFLPDNPDRYQLCHDIGLCS